MGVIKSSSRYLLIIIITTAVTIYSRPIVDPGLFMIYGVETCGNGTGYCLLGLDCTLDDDFLPDNAQGHCNGLSKSFTPSAHFTCCMVNNNNTKRRPVTSPTPISSSNSALTTAEISTTTSSLSVTGNSADDSTAATAAEISSPSTSDNVTSANIVTETNKIIHHQSLTTEETPKLEKVHPTSQPETFYNNNSSESVFAPTSLKETNNASTTTPPTSLLFTSGTDIFVDVDSQVLKEVSPPPLHTTY